jgi:hypothetical protein
MASKSNVASSSAGRASAIAPSFCPASIQRRKKASMKTISSATSLWNSGSWGANSSAALTSMQPRRCSSSTDHSMFTPKNVRIATDGQIDHGYRYSQLHAACLRLRAAYGPVAARKTAQITTILAITSPANGSTAERIDALVVASTGGA